MSTPSKGTRAAAAAKMVRSNPTPVIIAAEDQALLPRRQTSWKKLISSMSTSMVVHAIVLFILSWLYFDLPNRNVLESILWLTRTDDQSARDNIQIDLGVLAEPTIEPDNAADSPELIAPLNHIALSNPLTIDPDIAADQIRPQKANTPVPKSANAKLATSSNAATASKSTTKKGLEAAEVVHTDHFAGRSPAAKQALLKRMGGTDASEAAVARGLVWLKNHQLPDGSWNFYHLHHPRCDCSMPGRLENNPNAATAMALLAFLGAGHTHETGDYQTEVQQGLDFLVVNGMPVEKGICFYGQLTGPQTYYTHGLVTIALGEAFAMTSDARLRPVVTGAVDYLAATQESGGGWRYYPGQPGDTSVVAWQLMALKSAQFSRINVPQKVLTGVDRFMRSVSSMRGSQYSYTPDRKESPTMSMTAAGLLCRMYLDWTDKNGGMRAGIRILDEHGPEPEGMYYNYYATQVMHHWGGPEWDRWNKVMREHLINTQIQFGHATGSWDVADRHGNMGGRLYMTTLALLTLEVYYRHLPLYQKDRIEIPLIQAADAQNR